MVSRTGLFAMETLAVRAKGNSKPVLPVTENPAVLVTLPDRISMEHVMAWWQDPAGPGIVLQVEMLLLRTEPCVTDKYPAHAKGFLIRVRAVWLT